MDLKAKIEDIVKKIKSDEDFANKFSKDPVKAVEDVLGVDLPEEKVQTLVEGVKAKLASDGAGDLIGKASDMVGKAKKMF